jgi:hypothetical protein
MFEQVKAVFEQSAANVASFDAAPSKPGEPPKERVQHTMSATLGAN